MCKYETVFQDELPDGLPPKGSVHDAIEVEKNMKTPHRLLFQLSPEEPEAAKKLVEEMLEKGDIRPSKYPYNASLFFVKQKNKPLRYAVDYWALKHITKDGKKPLPHLDEMFDE